MVADISHCLVARAAAAVIEPVNLARISAAVSLLAHTAEPSPALMQPPRTQLPRLSRRLHIASHERKRHTRGMDLLLRYLAADH